MQLFGVMGARCSRIVCLGAHGVKRLKGMDFERAR